MLHFQKDRQSSSTYLESLRREKNNDLYNIAVKSEEIQKSMALIVKITNNLFRVLKKIALNGTRKLYESMFCTSTK